MAEASPSVLDFPVKECRVVLLGKTCNGKSSTGNSLLDQPGQFTEGEGVASATGSCHTHRATRFGVELQVVDTPGFFDPETDEAALTGEIIRCVEMAFPGPHALLLVLRADVVFTKEESDAISRIRSVFGDDVMRYVIIVFTHCDSEEDLKKRLEKAPPLLKGLLEDTDQRHVLMNNKETDRAERERQVKRLLTTVRGVMSYNNNQPFEHPLLRPIQETVNISVTELGRVLGDDQRREGILKLIRAFLEKKESAEDMVQGLLEVQSAEASLAADANRQNTQLQNALNDMERRNAQLQEKLIQQKTRGGSCVVL